MNFSRFIRLKTAKNDHPKNRVIMMSGDEYVKYVTESMLKYLLSSKEERKIKKGRKASFSFRFFGIIPLLLSFQMKKIKRKWF